MFVRISYSNGYCGCDETEVLEVENMEEAETYAEENVNQYGNPMSMQPQVGTKILNQKRTGTITTKTVSMALRKSPKRNIKRKCKFPLDKPKGICYNNIIKRKERQKE